MSDDERPGADLGSDDDRPGADLGSDDDRPGADLGSDDDRPGVDLGSDDDRPGVDLGDLGSDDDRPARGAPARGTGRRGLPNVPPGSRPEDERSDDALAAPGVRGEGGERGTGGRATGKRPPPRARDLESDEASLPSEDLPVEDLDARGPSDEGPISGRVSDLGPVGASGPLVIIDDEAPPDASSRYQASIVDDSARLAGARGPGERRKQGRAQVGVDDPEDVDFDGDVPVPERSARAARQSARSAPPPPPRSRAGAGLLLLVVGLVVGAGIGLGVGEWRRQRDLGLAVVRYAQERDAAVADAKRIGEDALGKAQVAARQAEEARQQAEAARQADRDAARRDADAARTAGEAAGRGEGRREGEAAGREAAEREGHAATEALVEQARERATADAAAERERALADAKAASDAALAAQAETAEQRRARDLSELERRLRAELEGSATREEEEAMARMLEAERAGAGGGAAAPGGGAAPSANGGGGGDWDSFFSNGGASGGAEAPAEPDASAMHPVDRAWAWLRENVHGKLGYRNLSHFSRHEPNDVRKTRHELRLALEYRGALWRSEDQTKELRLQSKLDVRVTDDGYSENLPHGIDDEERRRPIAWPEELHLDLTVDAFTVRAGWQLYAWGTGDLFNPTDILNPIDFSDLFDTRRISVPSVSAEVGFEHISLEAVVIPSFTRSRLPLRNRRFDLVAASPLPVLRPDDPPQSAQNAQVGARGTLHAGGWDVSLCGFSGWDDLPSSRLSAISINPLVIAVDPKFDRIHMLGADFATTLGFLGLSGRLGDILGGIQLHGEAAHIWADGERQDDIAQGVIGMNYTWIDLIREHDLTLILEYAGDYETDHGDEQLPGVRLNRVLRGAVLARLVYQVDEDLSFEVNTAVITHGDENALIHPGVTWSPTDNLRLALGGDIFLGPEETFFGQFKTDGRVIFDIAWEW